MKTARDYINEMRLMKKAVLGLMQWKELEVTFQRAIDETRREVLKEVKRKRRKT